MSPFPSQSSLRHRIKAVGSRFHSAGPLDHYRVTRKCQSGSAAIEWSWKRKQVIRVVTSSYDPHLRNKLGIYTGHAVSAFSWTPFIGQKKGLAIVRQNFSLNPGNGVTLEALIVKYNFPFFLLTFQCWWSSVPLTGIAALAPRYDRSRYDRLVSFPLLQRHSARGRYRKQGIMVRERERHTRRDRK